MPIYCRLLLIFCLLLAPVAGKAQTVSIPPDTVLQAPHSANRLAAWPQKDIRDVTRSLFPRHRFSSADTVQVAVGKPFVWIIPAVGYTQQTRGLLQLTGNVAFQSPGANMSTILAALAYTQNRQAILTITSSVWTEGNQLNWVGDWRLMHYPQDTYGLGMHTSTDRAVAMDYEYLRLYQSVLRRLLPNFYGGLGYQLDYHWNIDSRQDGRPVYRISDYEPGVTGRSVSSGATATLLYDNRGNAINPEGGSYASLLLRQNLQALGSDANYQALLLDLRHYLPLGNSRNILAFWSYNAFTLHGRPPFLDLPSTGWDTYNNLGRGFIQGRFRGRNLLYGEAEYRFGLTRNGLLGAVVFANAQTVTESPANHFDKLVPAAGLGLRIRMNKVSRTNLSVDYGFGADGSRGLLFNLGEVF